METAASGGLDTVRSSVSFILGPNTENLVLTGDANVDGTGNLLANRLEGNVADNVLTGLAGNDTLIGNAGNDTLNGMGGTDTLRGGLGDDTYVMTAGDLIVENVGEGTDLVQSAISYALTSNVENLTLTGTAAINGTGNTLDNVITGNAGNNTLNGGAGNDTLIGGAGNDRLDGGAGEDILQGGTGNDTYVVGLGNDTLTENADEGTDTVKSSITHTLEDNIENLILTGTSPIDGTGNASDNVLTGNSAANMLDGGDGNDTLNGGVGNDTLIGGGGDDTFIFGAGDTMVEELGGGTDTVVSSITHTLADNFENLTLSGASAINGTGNAGDNVLIGNVANNVLVGAEGNDTLNGMGGVDTLRGGLGDDTYVMTAGDLIVENAGEGTDLVQSAISYALTSNVENLTLTGTSMINGTGNTLDNVITGNAGNNTLNGGAGADTLRGGGGNDTLIGGAGADTFVFDTAPAPPTATPSPTSCMARIRCNSTRLPLPVWARPVRWILRSSIPVRG